MKKLLLGLLSFIIVLAIFNYFMQSNNDNTVDNGIDDDLNLYTEVIETPNYIQNIEDDDYSYAPIEVNNITNFETTWFCISTDGNIESNISYNNIDVKVHHNGSNIESNSLFRDGVPLMQGTTYTISFSAYSSIERNIEVRLLNADTWITLFKEDVHITSDNNSYDVTFTMNQGSIWNARLAFNFGNNGINDEHEINFSNILLKRDSDFGNTIKINQIGYKTTNQKRCVFPYNQGDYFNVIDVNSNEVVYTGAIVNKIENEETNEINYYGDFTNVTKAGTYRIESQLGGTSASFIISEKLYTNIYQKALQFLNIQRCGQELSSEILGGYGHLACHDEEAIVYDYPDLKIDVSGGWHDAGDYGRYVITGTKTLTDLLLSYMYNPNAFGDNDGTTDSNNGIPDILDEARYELEWLMKMQMEDGGVYSKAVTNNFALDVSPEEDSKVVYVLPSETISTADFISVMSLASICYKDIDKNFSKLCLEKAKLSWNYVEANPGLVTLENPSDINAGLYRDDKNSDERFFASMALYVATNDNKYLKSAKNIYEQDDSCVEGNTYQNVGLYGVYIYLLFDENYDEFHDLMLQSLKDSVESILSFVDNDGYNVSINEYKWGSNGDVVDNGIALLLAYDITNDERYRQASVEQLNYIFGKNSLDMTFVTGFGINSPQYPHHRMSRAKGLNLVGALVGGPDANRDDNITAGLSWDIPVAKVYVDEYLSYSSNEVSIYWNGSLIHLLTRLRMF